MIGALLQAAFLATKGVFKLGVLTAKGSYKLAKMGYKTFNKSVKLAKKVRGVLNKSRKLTVQNIQRIQEAKQAHVFIEKEEFNPQFQIAMSAGAGVAAELAQQESMEKRVKEVRVFTK